MDKRGSLLLGQGDHDGNSKSLYLVIVVEALRTHWRRFPFWIVALMISAYIGSRFPDIDQHTDLLTHRSILTHGLLVPLVLFLVTFSVKKDRVRDLVLIFVAAIAIHLSFDLFPKAWDGYALIHIPNIGWTPALVSKVWIFVSIVFCLYSCINLINKRSQGLLFVLGTIIIFIYQSFGEAEFFAPLMTLVISSGVVIWWKFTPPSSKKEIFGKIIGVILTSIRTLMKLLAGSYRIISYEYNLSKKQRQPFRQFLQKAVLLWLILFITTVRRAFKNNP